MSTNEHEPDAEIVSDLAKARCRRNRRPSVQFIDKNLIRRRSSGQEKQQLVAQKAPLPSITSIDESEATDADQQQQYCENLQ